MKRKSAKDISFLYQFAVWLNCLICSIALVIIGCMIGFENVFGNLIRSLQCVVLIGIILCLIIKYRRKEKRKKKTTV